VGLPETPIVAKRQRLLDEHSTRASASNLVIHDEPPQMRVFFTQRRSVNRDAADDLFTPKRIPYRVVRLLESRCEFRQPARNFGLELGAEPRPPAVVGAVHFHDPAYQARRVAFLYDRLIVRQYGFARLAACSQRRGVILQAGENVLLRLVA